MQPSDRAATVSGVKEVLTALNSLSVGELSRLQDDLRRARETLASLGQDELSERVGAAQEALRRGDMKEFRRALANVTARLGHLK